MSEEQDPYPRDLVSDLRHEFQDPECRHAYANSHLNCHIAAQLKAIREARGMSQLQLAEAIGTKQSGVSRIENCNNPNWNLETLRKIARAFDVRLVVSFEEFGTLPVAIADFSSAMIRRPFPEDPLFSQAQGGAPPSDETT